MRVLAPLLLARLLSPGTAHTLSANTPAAVAADAVGQISHLQWVGGKN